MFHRFILSCVCFIALPSLAQNFSLSRECQEAVRAGEVARATDIYDACGFNDRQKALGEWSLWAEKEKAGQALYEICVRHKGAESYCQKAINLENGPALLQHANKLYNQKDYASAANFYSRALVSPLLTEAEKGDIAQKMGLLYMNPQSNYYNPQKGKPLIERAVERRGAEANNLMGVLALFGMQGTPKNAEESFKYLWRAVLLGCPAAEENLGLWHLAKQKKIDTKRTRQEMTKRMFSCIAPDYVEPVKIPKNSCDCQEVAAREQLANLYPYRLTEISNNQKSVILLDRQGKEIKGTTGTQLPNGMKINDIKNNAVFLTTNGSRIVLKLAPVDNCPQLCQQKEELKEIPQTIKPYHLTFTAKECADILYYAERLVDTNLPFTGKTECSFSADMDKAADLLMQL